MKKGLNKEQVSNNQEGRFKVCISTPDEVALDEFENHLLESLNNGNEWLLFFIISSCDNSSWY